MKVNSMSFKAGQEMKIRVKVDGDCSSFSINIGHDDNNIGLHFNPRFDYGGLTNTIVCNSLSGGCWGEEQHESLFPFTCGEDFKLYINFNNEQFYIKLPDGNMMNFPNRLGDVKYNFFAAWGGARVVSIQVK